MRPKASLFEPFAAGALQLKNRIVMAPMTRSRAEGGNVPSALAPLYYAQRASGGLLITEGSQVSRDGVGYISTPGIHSAEQIAGWRKVTDAVHKAGGLIVLQLWHVGRVSHPDFHGGELPVAPSAVGFDGMAFTHRGPQKVGTPRALTLDEIAALIERFREGAANAKAAGFDGVEIHGANGYLPDQFLQDGTNKRTDAYGGSPANRARFLLEITRAAIDVWGPGRVGVRLSPFNPFNGMDDSDKLATFGHAIRALDQLPLSYLHLVEGQGKDGRGVLETFGGLYKGALMINGGFDAVSAKNVLGEGRADLVSFGIPYLANPDLPERLRDGSPLNQADRATFYGGTEKGYTDYPRLA